jgi:beta-glucosidase
MDKAIGLASSSEACVVVAGTDRMTENEGHDRSGLGLPGDQETLIRGVVMANPRTVVVLECGSVVETGWVGRNSPAVLQAWFPGEEGGTAIADVIFGESDPGGRLPLTWYSSESRLPPMDDYDVSRGRTYMYLREPPAYPFGYGLSYAIFLYSDLRLGLKGDGSVEMTVWVMNSSARRGDEVVQCYLSGPDGCVGRPSKMLAGFSRVSLGPRERKRVAITIGRDSFRCPLAPAETRSGAVHGRYFVMAGPNSSTGLVESIDIP